MSLSSNRALVAGINGDPTYLTVQANGTLHPWGVIDICTHLGCTFPWNPASGWFECPCHGSRYDAEGRVVRGPADRPLQLVQVEVEGDRVWLFPWEDTDPRTGRPPWWL